MALPQLIFRILTGVVVIGIRSARQAYRQAASSAPGFEPQTPEWAKKLGFASSERYQELRLNDAIDILGLKKTDKLPEVKVRFEHLTKANNPEKGGSEYLYGKIHGSYNLVTKHLTKEMTVEQMAKRYATEEDPSKEAKKDQL